MTHSFYLLHLDSQLVDSKYSNRSTTFFLPSLNFSFPRKVFRGLRAPNFCSIYIFFPCDNPIAKILIELTRWLLSRADRKKLKRQNCAMKYTDCISDAEMTQPMSPDVSCGTSGKPKPRSSSKKHVFNDSPSRWKRYRGLWSRDRWYHPKWQASSTGRRMDCVMSHMPRHGIHLAVLKVTRTRRRRCSLPGDRAFSVVDVISTGDAHKVGSDGERNTRERKIHSIPKDRPYQ